MNWADRCWCVGLIAGTSWREHRAASPWRISTTTIWPRALLQCLFFTMLGRVVGGEAGQAYTFVGSIAITIALFTLGELGDVPVRDRAAATLYRLRSGRLPVALVHMIRCWPVAAEAAVMAPLCILVIGLLTGQAALVRNLLPLIPIFLVLVLTSAAAGLAAATVGLFGRDGADVIVGNLGMYLIISASGALIPPGRVAWLDAIGAVLPMRHGLQAVRHQLAGQPWQPDLVTEVLVGGGWALVAAGAYALLLRRVRSTDHDKVT